MERYEGSDGVSNARTAIVILAVLLLIGGLITLIVGLIGETSYYGNIHEIYWNVVAYGLFCLFLSISLFITNAVLKGVEHIAKASEIYMEEVKKKKLADMDEKKKESDDKIDYLCQD